VLHPEHHYIGDARWIAQQLSRLPIELRGKASDGYSKAWREAHDWEPEERFKEERARFAANSRLLHYVKRVQEMRSQLTNAAS
jgi:hypothetical protein